MPRFAISCDQLHVSTSISAGNPSNKGDRDMNHLAPSYLLPNILIGSIAVVAAVLFGIRRAIIRAGLPVRELSHTFWSIATPLLTWFLVAVVLSWSGFYQGAPSSIP